jgi:hypothetical protein
METYELLDRFELLYPTKGNLADLRRSYIDKDLSSIFRLTDADDDLRKSVLEQNLHSIFRLTETDEELRKAIIEKNLHSIFRLTDADDDLRKSVLEKNLHSIFRLTNVDEDFRKAVVEKNLHSIFRLLPSIDITGNIDDLRSAVLEQNLNSIFRLVDNEELRKAVVEENLHSIFRIIDDEELRKAVVEENLHSIFRLIDDEELRKAVVEQNLHSIFRLVDDEELRRAVVEQNLHSIFRLIDDEELRKLIIEDNIWKLWPVLDRYVDTQFVAAFKNFFVNETEIWNDCFSRGQIKSKLWIVKELTKLNLDLGTVFLCAGWYATLATMLFESKIKVGKIRSFDSDPSCAKIAEVFNKPWFEDDWRFKASTVDIMDFEWTDVPAPSDGTLGNFYYMTSGTDKPIQMKDNPDTIINTSCEHIENFEEWYNNIPDGKLVILQSNDYFEIEEHVNCHKSISQFSKSAPMSETLFEGELFLPDYTRFMKIGYK